MRSQCRARLVSARCRIPRRGSARQRGCGSGGALRWCEHKSTVGSPRGEGRLNYRDVRDLADLYQAPADLVEKLTTWARKSVQPGGYKEYDEVMSEPLAELIGGEAEARSEIDYEHGLVPGLLQCGLYTEAQAVAAGVEIGQVPLVVGLRRKRQLRLTDDEPLVLEAFIEEQVLHRPIGSVAVMRKQFEHLLTMGALPNVTVRIIRTAVGYHRALSGRFIVLEFTDFPTAVYLEQPPVIGSRYADDPTLVTEYHGKIQNLREQADSAEESVELITSLMAALPLEG
jgi:hypothetical protein